MKVRNLTRSFMIACRVALPAVIALLGLGLLAPARGQSFDTVERQRALDMLSVIRDDLKKNYYDPTLHGMDVDARFKAAEGKLKQAASLGQGLGIIGQAVLDLNDSHSFFIPPPRPEHVEYGWNMQMIGNKCYVVSVKPNSLAEKTGLKIGDEVLSLEGFRPTRKDMWKMDYYYRTLSPRPGLRVVVQSPGAEPRQLDVPAKVWHGKGLLTFEQDYNQIIRESEDQDRLDRHRFSETGGVIIWKFPNFEFEPEQADSIMSDRIKGHATLILDLRGNPGGYVKTLERLVGNFFDHDLKIADRKGRKVLKPQLAKTRGKAAFDGKLIVLVDSGSASAAEIFARLIQLEKRGVVIGDQTAGAVMEARQYSHEVGTGNVVPYGASITDADIIMSDGKSVEHVGVTPDELLLPSAQDLATHRDIVLARAVELAGSKIDPAKAGELFPIEWRKMP
jgi:C-terminal processing protease CtpA/Prc